MKLRQRFDGNLIDQSNSKHTSLQALHLLFKDKIHNLLYVSDKYDDLYPEQILQNEELQLLTKEQVNKISNLECSRYHIRPDWNQMLEHFDEKGLQDSDIRKMTQIINKPIGEVTNEMIQKAG